MRFMTFFWFEVQQIYQMFFLFCFLHFNSITIHFLFFNNSLLYKSFYLSKFLILHIVHPPDCELSIIFCPDFQNYLRTQTGNNTTVNIIISTVDYLLRVQVSFFYSIMLLIVEFYSNDCNSHDGLKKKLYTGDCVQAFKASPVWQCYWFYPW